MTLRDEQVGGAVAVVVAGDDGARIFQLNLVETDIGGDVFESVWPEIAEEADFAFAIGGFAYRDQVDPAVVVVVEGGYTPGASPVGLWKINRIETLSLIVLPKRDARRTPVGEGKIHPAVVVEVENRNSDRRGGRHRSGPRLLKWEFAFARILEDRGWANVSVRQDRWRDRCYSPCPPPRCWASYLQGPSLL